MNESLPSEGIELDDFPITFEELSPSSDLNDAEDWEYKVQPSQFSPKISGSHYKFNGSPNLAIDGEILNCYDHDGLKKTPPPPPPPLDGCHTNILYGFLTDDELDEIEKKGNSSTTEFVAVDINDLNPLNEVVSEANVNQDFGIALDSSSPFDSYSLPLYKEIIIEAIINHNFAVLNTSSPIDSDGKLTQKIVEIKKSTTKKNEGHYKAADDVIVAKYFLRGKVERIKFQTIDAIRHGETVKISLEASLLGKEGGNKPHVSLEKEIPDKYQCACLNWHVQSRFCVVSEKATVDWTFSDDGFVASFKPVTNDVLEFDIGLWSTNFGDNYAAQLVFQLDRDGKMFEQRYFVKTCALLGRDLKSFARKIDTYFGSRCKWFKDKSGSEDEPQQKKMRSEAKAPAQITPLFVQCPSENTMELLNLLQDNSQYKYLKL